MPPRWTPHVTVAAVVERRIGGQSEFLLVEEHTPDGLRLNNPAGHLEAGESPQQAVVREVLEETARIFVPDRLVGVYLSRQRRPEMGEDVTYLRLAFGGSVSEPDPTQPLDDGIVRTLWMGMDALGACQSRHRSPLLMRCVLDHLAGRRLPLDAIHVDPSVFG